METHELVLKYIQGQQNYDSIRKSLGINATLDSVHTILASLLHKHIDDYATPEGIARSITDDMVSMFKL